jgi:hypothetical protein
MIILEYLQLLPESLDGVNVRQLAIRNYDKNFFTSGRKIEDGEDALCAAFLFLNTPEGSDFWRGIAKTMRGVKLPAKMGGLFGLEKQNEIIGNQSENPELLSP